MSFRHECEVRHVIKLGIEGAHRVDSFLALVAKRRNTETAKQLRADAKAQWLLGSRGEYGDWRDANYQPTASTRAVRDAERSG